MFYPAYVHSEHDGSASGFFPDVPGCYFAGDTLDRAFEDAKSALDAHFELLSEDNQSIPTPTGRFLPSGAGEQHAEWRTVAAGRHQYG
ncbi:Uncharacterised protein family (UPF0150) [Serratia quinivorans]|uniref:HicB-like antitoxin of toxin-antitoxin system domain-containing protein n=1 Tax=Serratia quinivorans TaxID=137545 RepID=A0A380APP5_9GAMM|nr:Uncharacterised protein family (UPF0150) [Serratia quinivorans]